MRQASFLLGLGFASFAVCVVIRRLLRSNNNETPKKWRKVGILGDLMMFPVKSCGVVRAKEMECTDIGLNVGWLKDRYFMIINSKSEFMTARAYPKLVLIQPKAVENILILNAPGTEPLEIDMKALKEDKTLNAKLWGDSVKSIDCGEEAAKWFSQFIFGKPSGARLVRFPELSQKTYKTRDKGIVTDCDTGAFPDVSSYNLINASSIDDLNTRLSVPAIPQQFRPNFVVEGGAPLEEDHWHWVKIGDVVLKAVKNCTRCVLTTVNPETGEKNPNSEPLATLKKYRIVPDAKQNVKPNHDKPVMGVHLVLQEGGVVKIGDTVMVA